MAFDRPPGYRSAVLVDTKMVHTGIWHFANPYGKKITLVGTMHIGEARYYGDLGKMLNSLGPKSCVHFEKVILDLSDATTEEREILESVDLGSLGMTLREFAAPLGWSYQLDELTLPDSAKNMDITAVELLRGLGEKRLREIVAAKELFSSGAPTTEASSLLRRTLKLSPLTMRVLKLARSPIYRVLIRQRNIHALRQAFRDTNDYDTIALVWGAAHLPDMGRLLTRNGFSFRGQSLLRVGDLP